MPVVLIIDDQSISRMILDELIRSISPEIQTKSFADPVAALEWAKNNDLDLVLTDYKMPNMDGIEFTQWLRKIPSSSDIPVVIITCIEDRSIRYRALESGATDFLTKPIDHNECRARCRNLLTLRRQQQIIKDRARWLENEIVETTNELKLREKETLFRLARAGEFRDKETGNHVLRMAQYSHQIAKELGIPDHKCDLILHAAPMHDIGKIAISDKVLLKKGKLDPREWSEMQNHSLCGFDILCNSPSKYLQLGALIARSHHERYDGKGYPDRLAGEEIPIEARIVAVADVFDALVSERPYKPAWSIERALGYLKSERGQHFDAQCVDAFIARLDKVEAIMRNLEDKPFKST
ncbi:MAG: response regulator [Candidatus Polarisedimenticolaceae bacterium]|nr:response regulator [Candidatus Polarisedimenticolaceae bacterium]